MCIKSSAAYQYCLFKRRLLPDYWEDTVAYLVARDHGWLEDIEGDVNGRSEVLYELPKLQASRGRSNSTVERQ
jgi:hypothetical protein